MIYRATVSLSLCLLLAPEDGCMFEPWEPDGSNLSVGGADDASTSSAADAGEEGGAEGTSASGDGDGDGDGDNGGDGDGDGGVCSSIDINYLFELINELGYTVEDASGPLPEMTDASMVVSVDNSTADDSMNTNACAVWGTSTGTKIELTLTTLFTEPAGFALKFMSQDDFDAGNYPAKAHFHYFTNEVDMVDIVEISPDTYQASASVDFEYGQDLCADAMADTSLNKCAEGKFIVHGLNAAGDRSFAPVTCDYRVNCEGSCTENACVIPGLTPQEIQDECIVCGPGEDCAAFHAKCIDLEQSSGTAWDDRSLFERFFIPVLGVPLTGLMWTSPQLCNDKDLICLPFAFVPQTINDCNATPI